MSSATTPTLIAILIQLLLGVVVFLANPKRTSNQCFLFLSIVIGSWLGSLYLAFTARSSTVAEFAIRQASAAGVLYFLALNLLRLTVGQKSRNWRDILSQSRIWLITTVGAVVICETKLFLRGAQLPRLLGREAPNPIYAPGADYAYAAYTVLAFVVLIVSYGRDQIGRASCR